MAATITESTRILLLGGLGVLLLWLLPSIGVAAFASDHKFSAWGAFFAALFLSWPLVLLGLVLFSGLADATREQRATISALVDGHATVVRSPRT